MATSPSPTIPAISPLLELGAYEVLWAKPNASFTSLAAMFRENPDKLPSDFVDHAWAMTMADTVRGMLKESGVEHFGVRIHRAGEYPSKLRDAEAPVELLYYRGWWDLVEAPSVAVVGTRDPSPEGIERAAAIARLLVRDKFTVVSGLAAGIDSSAHKSAIEAGGKTIAVIGTPINKVYPRENESLQNFIANNFLVISQVPVYRYAKQDYRKNRFFFPQRNITMSALTEATVIVEAGETSGTLTQARAAIHQGRKLFILDNCFTNPALTWPKRFEELGAVRVTKYDDIRNNLSKPHAPKTHEDR
jgi:DNA processing protein